MSLNIEKIARACHEANRALQIAFEEDGISPEWDDAPEWQRKSAINGVLEAISGKTPRELHETWVSFKLNDGWVYGPTKDANKLTHPCIVDYDELSAVQKAKDGVFHAIVRALDE